MQHAQQLLASKKELDTARKRVQAEQEAYQLKLQALSPLQAQYNKPYDTVSARQCISSITGRVVQAFTEHCGIQLNIGLPYSAWN